MSKAPRPPSHLRPIPVEIPASWTPEQELIVQMKPILECPKHRNFL
jgi:hypothetical protein